jgi:hypothetical protein
MIDKAFNELYCSFDLKGSRFNRQVVFTQKKQNKNRDNSYKKLATQISKNRSYFDKVESLMFQSSKKLKIRDIDSGYRETTLKDLDFEILV